MQILKLVAARECSVCVEIVQIIAKLASLVLFIRGKILVWWLCVMLAMLYNMVGEDQSCPKLDTNSIEKQHPKPNLPSKI